MKDFGYAYEYAERQAYKRLVLMMVDALISTLLLIAALVIGGGVIYMVGGLV